MRDRDPDLLIAGFRLWADDRDEHDPTDSYWHNCLQCRFRVETGRSSVSDAVDLSAYDLAEFNDALTKAMASLQGEAVLQAHESAALLLVRLSMKPHGHVELYVESRSGDLAEHHGFLIDIDQSYVAPFARQVRQLAAKFPPSGNERKWKRRSAGSSPILDFIFGKRS